MPRTKDNVFEKGTFVKVIAIYSSLSGEIGQISQLYGQSYFLPSSQLYEVRFKSGYHLTMRDDKLIEVELTILERLIYGFEE